MPATQDFTNFATERPNFFPGQFLLEDDFELQYKYLGDRQKYHNQSLQVSGILEGLEVTPITDKKEVKIAPGTAIDGTGNLIVLKNEVTFSTFGELTKGELYLEFVQTKTNKQQAEIAESFTRWTETVAIAVAEKAPAGSIPLCTYETIGDDEIKIDFTISQYSGIYLPNAENHDLSLRSGGKTNPNLAILSGDLKIIGDTETIGNQTIGGNLTITKKVTIQHISEDANGDTFVIGSTLRLGHNLQYGWIQSHSSKPLAINPIANNVGIGTTDPGTYKLNVVGDQYISKTLTIAGYFKSAGNNSGERVLLTETPLNENHRGDGNTQAKTGLALRVASNPASGDPIFQVQSSGQAVRFFVEHDGWTGAKDNSAWFGGSNKNYFKSQLVIASTNDADLGTANSGALIIGDSNAAHLAIDNNEIIAKNNGTTAGTLNFQAEGGETNIGGTFNVEGAMTGVPEGYTKAQFTLSGGGVVSWDGIGGRLKWTQRFIAISMQRSAFFPAGYINIYQPTSDISAANVYDGKARSANANGVVLKDWEALYAVHTIKGDQSAISYQIVKYTNSTNPPSNWILVAVVNSDDGSVKLGSGQIIHKTLRNDFIIAGFVNASGDVVGGSGFTVTKRGTGLYDVNFARSFSTRPAVVATQHYGSDTGNTRDNAVVTVINTDNCRIKTGNGNGDAADRHFCFFCTGAI
ncbi:MAG: hypothetical protein HC799_15265 [Limnothrix sp. RL_2_0]|nr:hypothetical protein [Limnothrix sp. RL_2_0]